MQNYQLTAPCHFGLEAVCKREIYDLGYEITKVEDGRVTFAADAEGICRANIFLRTAERVLLEEDSVPPHLMNFLKELRHFHGKTIFQRMENSG